MRRRSLLAATGSALASAAAGCLAEGNGPAGNGDGNGNGNGNGNGTNGGEPGSGSGSPEDFGRQVDVTAVDDVPDSVPVEFDVRVVDGAITPEGTAVLEVSVTNTGDTGREVTTPYYKGLSDGNPGVLLYSLEAPDSPDRGDVPPCIVDPVASQEHVEWTDEGPLSHQLDPGATATDELVLASDPTVDGCFPSDEYRFEDHHSVDGTEFTWGFTVEVGEGSGGEGTDDHADRRYEECPREIIPYDQFPDDVQAEIDAALEGRYEADRVYLREAMDTDESYISVDGDYYEAEVTEEGDREVLTLGLVEPRALPQERPVKVEHGFGGRRTITLELVATDGTVLIEGTRELLPGAEVEFGRTDRVGSHELRVTVADGEETTAELTGTARVDESRFSVLAVVEHDGITLAGTVAELGVCQYDG